MILNGGIKFTFSCFCCAFCEAVTSKGLLVCLIKVDQILPDYTNSFFSKHFDRNPCNNNMHL